MNRFFVEPAEWNDYEIILSAASEHHLVDVLRISNGEMVSLFDGKGRTASARVAVEKGRRAVLKVSSVINLPRPRVSITLFQAMPKGARIDLIIEKATEIGASAVYPVMTERVVVRLQDDSKKEDRRGRWHRIAVSAAEQSGVNWVPAVNPIIEIDGVVGLAGSFDLFLVGALTAGASALREVLAGARQSSPSRVALLIGPEGDLTPLELKMVMDAGAKAVSFGPNVFRVETAAIFGLSVLAYELKS